MERIGINEFNTPLLAANKKLFLLIPRQLAAR